MDSQITAEIKKRGVPPLRAQQHTANLIIYVKLCVFLVPCRWYASECEIEEDGDVLFFGFVSGEFGGWGYFRLSELGVTENPLLVTTAFKPMPFSELKKEDNL